MAEILLLPALPPSAVHAGFGLFAPFLSEGLVVGIPFGTAAVVGGRIIGIEGGAGAESFRQVRIGQKLATEGDQIRPSLPEPRLGRVLIEATGHDERAAVFCT